MGVKNSQLADLIATTLEDLPKDVFEIAWDSQDFEFSRIYNQNRRTVDGGTSIQRNIILDRQGTARYRRLFDTDEPSVQNNHSKIDVPWTQVGVDYSWDVLEIMRNRNSAAGYIDLIKSRREERVWDLAELLETRGWLTPTNSSDDLNPYGIPYYLNFRDNADTGDGFDGQTIRYQDGSTGTTAAGLDASTNPKWRNYAATYEKVDNTLLRTLRKAFLLTRFRPPAMSQAPGQDQPGPLRKLYCNSDIAVELADLADKRDDNNTSADLAGKALVNVEGMTMFNRVPIRFIPQLDGADFDPIYYVDWDKIRPIVQDGYWMIESDPMVDRGQHTTVTVFLDGSHQNLCINRRTAGFVVHKVTS